MIFGVPFKVVRKTFGSRHFFGEVDWQAQTIQLSPAMAGRVTELATLAHEIGHVWLDRSGLLRLLRPLMRKRKPKGFIAPKYDLEEAICDMIGWGVVDLILHNPTLLKYAKGFKI